MLEINIAQYKGFSYSIWTILTTTLLSCTESFEEMKPQPDSDLGLVYPAVGSVTAFLVIVASLTVLVVVLGLHHRRRKHRMVISRPKTFYRQHRR